MYQKHISQIVDNLYLGSFHATKECILKEYDIKTVFSIGCDPFSKHQKGIEYFSISIEDNTQSVGKLFNEILPNVLPLIHKKIQERGNCLIHCSAGKSRSPTVVAAYLMTFHDMNANVALEHIKGQRPCVYPNYGFVDALQDFTV